MNVLPQKTPDLYNTIIGAFALIFTMTYNCIHAQITYQASHYATPGDSMLFSEASFPLNSWNFDTTGRGISWDYSSLQYKNQTTSSYFDPSNSGYKNSWCLTNGYVLSCSSNFSAITNMVIHNIDTINLGFMEVQNVVAHELLNAGLLQKTMIGMTAKIQGVMVPMTFSYEYYDALHHFPFSINSIDSSESRVVLDFSPAPFVQSRNQKRTNEVVGWGSLYTPYGSFDDVLKMTTTISKQDTIFLNETTIPTSSTQIEYKWWSLDHGLPVLTASGNKTGELITITKVSYLDTKRCVDPKAYFTYLPVVPALDSLTMTSVVQFTNRSQNADSVIWDFGDGTISSAYNPLHTYQSSGLFNASLKAYHTCDPTSLKGDTLSLPLRVADTTIVTSVTAFNQEIPLTVSPNPARDQITLTGTKGKSWIIINLLGKQMLKGKGSQVDLSSLKTGIYLIKVGDQTKRVMIE